MINYICSFSRCVLFFGSMIISAGCISLIGRVEHSVAREKALENINSVLSMHALERQGYKIRLEKTQDSGGIVAIVTVSWFDYLKRNEIGWHIADDIGRIVSQLHMERGRHGAGTSRSYLPLTWTLVLSDIDESSSIYKMLQGIAGTDIGPGRGGKSPYSANEMTR